MGDSADAACPGSSFSQGSAPAAASSVALAASSASCWAACRASLRARRDAFSAAACTAACTHQHPSCMVHASTPGIGQVKPVSLDFPVAPYCSAPLHSRSSSTGVFLPADAFPLPAAAHLCLKCCACCCLLLHHGQLGVIKAPAGFDTHTHTQHQWQCTLACDLRRSSRWGIGLHRLNTDMPCLLPVRRPSAPACMSCKLSAAMPIVSTAIGQAGQAACAASAPT